MACLTIPAYYCLINIKDSFATEKQIKTDSIINSETAGHKSLSWFPIRFYSVAIGYLYCMYTYRVNRFGDAL